MRIYKIKDLPEADRPREKLLKHGAEFLTNAELLAILLRTGTKDKSALMLAGDIIKAHGEKLSELAKTNAVSLSKMKGIGQTKALTVVAALELGRRVDSADILEMGAISTSAEAARVFRPYLRDATKEHFYVMLLTAKNKLISVECLSVGTIDNSVASPRDVFAAALLKNASAVIIAHNHPSGEPLPSMADRALTARMIKVGDALGVRVLDHIIIGLGSYYSFQDETVNQNKNKG